MKVRRCIEDPRPPARRRVAVAALSLGLLGPPGLALGGASAAGTGTNAAVPSAAVKCKQPITLRSEGKASGVVCPEQLGARGLTVIDLGDTWVPYALAGAAISAGQAPPAYHDTFVELAAEKFVPGSVTAEDGALEFFGVPPNFHVVLKRMDDEQRHRCHDGVADESLASVTRTLHRANRDRLAAEQKRLARDRGLVQAALRRRKLPSTDALAAASPAHAKLLAGIAAAEQQAQALTAVQDHLVCEGLLPGGGASRGQFDVKTGQALRAYQLRHWIVGHGELDGETVAALREDSRELELRLALRVLRERVSDAAGIIEDGSARAEWGTVLGRQLDGPALRYQGSHPPLANGAPDRISAATEATAKALGWRDHLTVRSWLHDHLDAANGPRFAVALPPVPTYHREGMTLRAEIDRGEVSYDVPRRRGASRAGPKAERRPVLIVYAKYGDTETALVRWPTTIGGWQDEKLANGAVVRRYKPSDTGPRLWRDLVVAPVWYPPRGTPDSELLRPRSGKWELKEDLLGPSYRSAYGLAMLIHHLVVAKDGSLYDRAIRTHGSANYPSITRGDSHGCHRIYNHHILGLASFLLRHHTYTVKGPLTEPYARKLRHGRDRFVARRTDRGFYYELTPPVPVEVLEGVIVGKRKTPVKAPQYGMR